MRYISLIKTAFNCTTILLSSVFVFTPLVMADTFEWTDAVGGKFSDAGKWTNTTGVDLPPPNAGDRVDFNEAGPFEVEFTQNEVSDILSVTAGDITFLSNSTTLRTFTLATGAADANISGGTIQVGTDTNPLFLNLPNISTGGGLNVSVMNIGSQANGVVTVSGSNSRLDVLGATNHSLGFSGNNGVLNVLDNATANFGVNGTLNVGDSSNSGSQGTVTVDTGGTLNTGNIDIAPQTSGATGMMSVIGSDASIRQTLAGATLNVGSSSGGTGTIRIENGAAFETGDGMTTFHSTGTLDMNGGTFTVNGPMTIDSGTILAGASSGGPNQVDLVGPITLSAVNNAQVFLPLHVDDNAMVNVATGADFFGFSAEVGSGSTGTVVVDGIGSTFDGFSLKIGTKGGEGLVTFQNSAEAGIFSFGGARLDIAVDSTQQSIGELNVLSGSLVSTDQLRLATQATTGSSASLVVDGVSSTMQSGLVSVGHASSGAATVEIRNGGTLLVDRFSKTVSVFETGRVDVGLVGSGTLTATTVAVNGGMLSFGAQGLLSLDTGGSLSAVGGGRVDMAAAFVIEATETFDIGDGAVLAMQDDLDVGGIGSSGTLTLGGNDSTVEVGGNLTIANTGTVTLNGGTLIADTFDHTNGGVFDFLGGALQVDSFVGNLVNQGGSLAPGPDAGPTAITGNYTQQSAGALHLEVGGTSPGGSHDVVTVSGNANIDGDFMVSLIGGFTPNSANNFTMLSASTLNGFFDNIFTGQRLVTTDGGGSFVVNYGIGSSFPSNQIVLSDFEAALTADFDFDGDIDGRDFLVWQRDGSPNGINSGDLALWQTEYGSPPLTANTTSVPEPSTCMLLSLVAAGAKISRRRRIFSQDSRTH